MLTTARLQQTDRALKEAYLRGRHHCLHAKGCGSQLNGQCGRAAAAAGEALLGGLRAGRREGERIATHAANQALLQLLGFGLKLVTCSRLKLNRAFMMPKGNAGLVCTCELPGLR